jgi:hypothetical protein
MYFRGVDIVDRKRMTGKILIIVGLIIIGSVLAYAGPTILLHAAANDDSYYIKNFKMYKEDFNNMKNRIIILSDEHLKSEVSLWINYNNDSTYFSVGDTKIELTLEEKEWVKNIDDACGTEALSRIEFNDNRILFGMDGNHYAFVYSVNGKAPKYMIVPSEYWKWARKSLGDDWYFFRSK